MAHYDIYVVHGNFELTELTRYFLDVYEPRVRRILYDFRVAAVLKTLSE